MTRKATGIDIGENSIKVVVLSHSGRQVTVSSFKEYPINGEDPSRMLAAMVKEGIIKTKAVFTGLSLDKVMLRETILPFSDRKRIVRTLPFSLSDNLPFPINEAAYSYYLLERTPDESRIISFLAPKVRLETLRQTFSAAGLAVKAISVESEAISKALAPLPDGEGSYISLHLTLDASAIAIVEEKKIVFARRLNTKVNDLLKILAKGLNISYGESSKILFSGVDQDEVGYALDVAQTIAKDLLDQLIREVELSLKSFGLKGEKGYSIIISGEGASVRGLPAYVEEVTGRKVTSAELDGRIDVGDNVKKDDLTQKGMAALGYALMGMEGAMINFIRGEVPLFASPYFKLLYGQRRLLAAAAAVITLLYTLGLLVEVRFQKNRYLGLENQIEAIFKATLPDARIIRGKEEPLLKAALNSLEERASILSGDSSIKTVDILKEITTASPDNVSFNITRMRIDRDGIRITGETANYDGVEKIKQNLKRVTIFDSVEVGGAKTSKLQNIVEFQLNIRMSR